MTCTDLCRLQDVVLHHQHVLVSQTDVVLCRLRDGEQLVPDWLPPPRPEDAQLRLLLVLPTQEVTARNDTAPAAEAVPRPLTSPAASPLSDTMTWELWSQIILQKSFTVSGRGFWVTMNSRLSL